MTASRKTARAIARGIAAERGATVVPPYDDPKIIAGQGTAAREFCEDLAARGLSPDIVCDAGLRRRSDRRYSGRDQARFPNAVIMTAEPEGFDDHARSFRSGHRQPHNAEGTTICDALMAMIPGEITFAINRKLVSGGVTASDAEVGEAIAFAFREMKLVVEPGGAVALAALLTGRIDARGKTAVIVLSGGNVDADMFARLIG